MAGLIRACCFIVYTCICSGRKEWRGRCKRRRLSYSSPFSGTICCFACLEPQQNRIAAFITNRGQRLHPLVGKFLLRCSSEYFFCSGHSDHSLACSFLLQLSFFLILSSSLLFLLSLYLNLLLFSDADLLRYVKVKTSYTLSHEAGRKKHRTAL